MTKRVAAFTGNPIGDGLVFLVAAHNMAQAGYNVDIYTSPFICSLQEWFPTHRFQLLPTQDKLSFLLENYDQFLIQDSSSCRKWIPLNAGPGVYIDDLKELDRTLPYAQCLKKHLQAKFSLPHPTDSNGLIPPSHYTYRRYPKRVVIHPTSNFKRKNWLENGFLKLCKKLQRKEYDPYIVVGPHEYAEWEKKVAGKNIPLLTFPTIAELTQFVYESGYMIGNDSGVGHIASNVGIPQLTIFNRLSPSRFCRPGWGKNMIVLPTIPLPSRYLRSRWWKPFLFSSKVVNYFEKLVATYPNG